VFSRPPYFQRETSLLPSPLRGPRRAKLALEVGGGGATSTAPMSRRGFPNDRQAQGPDRLLRRGLCDPRCRRRRLSGALLVTHAAGAAVARRGRGALDRNL